MSATKPHLFMRGGLWYCRLGHHTTRLGAKTFDAAYRAIWKF